MILSGYRYVFPPLPASGRGRGHFANTSLLSGFVKFSTLAPRPDLLLVKINGRAPIYIVTDTG